MKPYKGKLEDAVEKIKAEYPSLWLTAKSYSEGRNVLLTILQRETNINKGAMAHWLNENTELKYDLQPRQGFKDNK